MLSWCRRYIIMATKKTEFPFFCYRCGFGIDYPEFFLTVGFVGSDKKATVLACENCVPDYIICVNENEGE